MTLTHSTVTYGRLFYGILKKELILLLRYKIDTVSGLVLTYGFFILLLFGGRSLGGAAFEDSVGALAVGFCLWILSAAAYQNLAGSMTEEASWGTLEQLHTSSLGFDRVIILTALAGVVDSFVRGTVMFVAVAVTSGLSFQFDILGVVVVALLGVASVLGIGFAFGALAVRYKRIDDLVALLSFGFTGLIAAPVGSFPVLRILPLTQSSYMVRRMINEGLSLSDFSAVSLVSLLVVSVGYLTLGYLILRYFINSARKAGVMGHY
ncbi:ABC transporter permease [Halobaculum sp. MBLA0143]|uniref:ABC transporter permease n=1 Tax=Halobaculum sp. MBLA0143 TaxID=3079933 RepID=UPI003524F016